VTQFCTKFNNKTSALLGQKNYDVRQDRLQQITLLSKILVITMSSIIVVKS